MNIAIVGVGYQCPHLGEVLEPWAAARKHSEFNFKICCVSALFKERQETGERYSNDLDEAFLCNLKEKGYIDEFIKTQEPILDYQSRVLAWDYLKNFNPDYIWQLDLFDEYYSYDEIVNTCKWISDNDLYDFYRVNFKNYFGRPEDKTYVLDFKPVRIINNKNNEGIDNFYFDNDVRFNNGVRTPHCAGITLPRKICNPKHLSWVGTREQLIAKEKYQRLAIKTCSYKWDHELNKIVFDEKYYAERGLSIPIVFCDL